MAKLHMMESYLQLRSPDPEPSVFHTTTQHSTTSLLTTSSTPGPQGYNHQEHLQDNQTLHPASIIYITLNAFLASLHQIYSAGFLTKGPHHVFLQFISRDLVCYSPR